MATYDFDKHVDRIGTDCLKWDSIIESTGKKDVRPLWVADMDFETPPFIYRAINKRLACGVLGYTVPSKQYYDSITGWLGRRYGVKLCEEQIHFIAGIVPGLHHAICALTEKGDKILIQTPVYHPFHHIIEINGRTKVESPLKLVDGRFEMDFDDLEAKLPGCKMMLLCNPHNPGGTVWRPEELKRLAHMCKEHGVLVVSDEIHADMTHADHKHIPFCMISEEAEENSLTFMAPSKAFNMPGIVTSYCFSHNSALRERFYHFLEQADVTVGNAFSYDCLQACYTEEGEEWLNQMLSYVTGNIAATEQFLAANCPKIKPMKTEASFLVFLDNREMPFESEKELVDFYLNDANLFLNEGSMFGHNGTMFMRLNVALPRQELLDDLEGLKRAYDKLMNRQAGRP
jgi:cysteine-S-conjugate beta-lyase